MKNNGELDYKVNQAAVKIRAGEVDEGRRILLEVLKKEPQNINAHLWIAYITDDIDTKIEYYRQVLLIEPKNPTAEKALKKYEQEKPNREYLFRRDDGTEGGGFHRPFASVPIDDIDGIGSKLEASRNDLLDLSLRNSLLNYRTLKSKGVDIVDELPIEIFRILVQENRTMTFLPARDEEEGMEQQSILENLDPEDIKLFEEVEENGDDVSARHTDNKLQTPYSALILQKRLLNTYHASKRYVEEQGVNILFLALGFLKWYESSSSELPRFAPLILLPVELTRSTVKAKFRLSYTDEELSDNLSLRAKLFSEFGLELPAFSEDEDLDITDYFDAVQELVSKKERWEVEKETIKLGFFSYGKFLMFHDLDPEKWPIGEKPEDHPLLHSLLGEGFRRVHDVLDDDVFLDDIVTPEATFQVVDADSSQSIAIYDASRGKNLVIQGPPGTGKSQTITNLIAEAVGNHKTVLFVSEKMAALEVVKRRLDAVGLGDACLELHSDKSRKKAIIDELQRAISLGKPRSDGQPLPPALNESRARLNAYSKAVNQEIGESHHTPFEVFGRFVLVKDALRGVELPKLEIVGSERWSLNDYLASSDLVQNFEVFVRKIGVPSRHPFWGTRITTVLPTTQQDIHEKAIAAESSLSDFQSSASKLAALVHLASPERMDDVSRLSAIAVFSKSAPSLDGINRDLGVWRKKGDKVSSLVNKGKQFQSYHQDYDTILTRKAWRTDVGELLPHVIRFAQKWWRQLSSTWRDTKAELEALCEGELPSNGSTQIEMVKAILESQALKVEIENLESIGEEVFKDQWQGLYSDWDELNRINDWLFYLLERIDEGQWPSSVGELVDEVPETAILDELISRLQDFQVKYEEDLEKVLTAIQLDDGECFGNEMRLIQHSFEDQGKRITAWHQDTSRLHEIITLNGLRDKLEERQLEQVFQVALRWEDAARHLHDLFEYAWLNALILRAFNERPALAQFDSEIHEHSVKRFCELDTKTLTQNRVRLAYEHWKLLPKYEAGGQLGILQREFAKKRRHMPIRKLIYKAGNVIQVIKPVFMMSPLSIAKYLSPGALSFDMIVFDEASQVRPVDAFGAILRGSQLIVVGDDRQLPPTSFFEHSSDTDEVDEDNITADLESILGLCQSQGMPQHMLRWHYRSQHESLITVSNYEFYDDKLVIFPSPVLERKEVGLVYHYLPDTTYEYGRSRTNRGEAKRVAEAVMHHAEKCPELSLGVAAFSMAQMQAVQDQVEIYRKRTPSFEPFFRAHPTEPFFVKNLENVQGDERDVILISVGYGTTEDGRLHMNFGPLNRQGGERRLNVLITRARKRCEVFTNLQSSDIDLSRTQARGVEAFKRFLKYAESGDMDMPAITGGEPDSPFEESVARKLRGLGYRVEHQVGSGGFFIDLAIVDEDKPGRFLLGIECDGAMYHSARSARDRDRLRQEVLENLGWQIHRIWSTDWFKDPDREIKRVESRIEEQKRKQATGLDRAVHDNGQKEELKTCIERDEPQAKSLEASFGQYRRATLRIGSLRDGLHEVPQQTMIQWINRVVDDEGPLHRDEVLRRICNAAKVKRAGRRIQEHFDECVSLAVHSQNIDKRRKFLWPRHMTTPPLRSRANLSSSEKKFDFIAPEEVQKAIEVVIESSFGISREEVATEVANLLGFKRTSEDMANRITRLIDDMVRNLIVLESNGCLQIADDA